MLTNFTMRVEGELKEEFIREAKKRNRTASLLVRDFMQEYIQKAQAKDHDEWFRSQVESGLREAADPATKTIDHDTVATNIMGRLGAR